MKVRFSASVMAHPEIYGRDLNAIVDTFNQGQHQWVFDDVEDVTSSRWITEAAPWDSLLRELVEKTWRAAIDSVDSSCSKQRLLIVSSNAEGEALGSLDRPTFRARPPKARQILEEAVHVVLENATSDWHFLCAMARAFDREVLMRAMQQRWLLPAHAGGGGDFLKRVDDLLGRGIVPWRIATLADSDRMAPGPLPDKVADMTRKIESRGVFAIVLFKREVENYLPDGVIDDKRHHGAWVSLLALSRTQRDYFDMKNGFKQNKSTQAVEIPAEQSELFAGANPWHLSRLIGGFGKRIGDRFEGAAITREEMTVVCGTCPGEIERILRGIEELL